ncbi:MAG: hypothetical protein PWQ39_183 [Thermacetogenium sp.]|nr:hypothetical protein [Thermacetogenium sp.]
MILLATGLSEIERKLETMLDDTHHCYHRSVLLDLVEETKADTVVLSPCLQGEQSIINDLVRPLRAKGVHIVFLPGGIDMPDAREWMLRLIPLGVYSYVFDPVTPEKVIHRIQNPGDADDLPVDIVREAFGLKSAASDPASALASKKSAGLLRKLSSVLAHSTDFEKHEKDEIVRDGGQLPTVEAGQNSKLIVPGLPGKLSKLSILGKPDKPGGSGSPSKHSKKDVPGLLGKLFSSGKPGAIANGDYVEKSWKDVSEIEPECSAVVIPSSWGIKAVRDLRRDPRFRAVPLIVLKGGREFLRAGADMCVRRLNPGVIEEVTALSRRYREFWKRAEFDSMTGLYKKEFLLEWIAEQERKPEPNFSVAMIDIDHFKSFNDTYGHQAGDAVLASFGAFLKSQIRATDVAARYGGEEFVIALPNTPAAGAQVLVDRLRENWSRRDITLPSGEKVKCTFSAGVAGYERGKDIVAEADRFLYKAKSEGRNRVEGAQSRRLKVLLLGQKVSSLGPQLLEQGLEVATDPADATIVVADAQGFGFAPAGKPLVVLGTGTIADFTIRKSRPDAKVVKDPESVVDALLEMLEKPKPVKNLKVLPGGRSDKGQSLALHSALYVVCPSRPGQAGEVAARLARDIEDCALVCAASESTGALALGIPEGDLICSDWRIPGSDAPVKWGGVTVWPVDPFKFLNVKDASAHALVEQIKPKFNLVVVDCAGNLEIASRAPKTDGVIVLHKEGDTADAATSYWLKNYAGSNVFVMSPSEVPDVLSVENGFIVAKRGASANMNG